MPAIMVWFFVIVALVLIALWPRPEIFTQVTGSPPLLALWCDALDLATP